MEFTIITETDKRAVKEYIDKLNISQREYKITIAKRSEKRTIPQNRLYRLWLNCISAESGNDVEDLHEYFKTTFLDIHSRIIYGKEIVRVTSTTELNTEQFKVYLDRVQQWASVELGIILPDPEDMIFKQFEERYKKLHLTTNGERSICNLQILL